MKKLGYLMMILAAMLVGAGCGKQDNDAAKSSSQKTVITSRKYTTAQLQKRYVALSDAVITPLNLATYKQPASAIKKAAASGETRVAKVALELADNDSEPALTKALRVYAEAAKQTLKTLSGTDQAAFNAASKEFFNECQSLGQQYFSGQLPESVVTFSKRSQAAAKASEAGSSSQDSAGKAAGATESSK